MSTCIRVRILFYSVLLLPFDVYSIQIYSILFYSILFYSTLFYSVLFLRILKLKLFLLCRWREMMRKDADGETCTM